ncbi:uncharacterized protein [Malus domestica]|uniref:uncharacterized protein n=1 Tax=Malus domestica TaxID=3750 RepID=UPI0010A9D1E7|nr:uncharacterized protein LOC108173896 [Malus domestica]
MAFSSLSMKTLSASTIVVFTSLKVKLYLDIPELNGYKLVFSNNTEAVKILASSSKQVNEAQILQIARRVTVDELAFLDPELYKKQLRNHINKEAVRRPLFTGTEQSVVEEMFEPSREDVDQIPVKLLKKKSSPTGAKTDSSPAKKQ